MCISNPPSAPPPTPSHPIPSHPIPSHPIPSHAVTYPVLCSDHCQEQYSYRRLIFSHVLFMYIYVALQYFDFSSHPLMSYCISKSLYLACTDDKMNPPISWSAWVTSEVESLQLVKGDRGSQPMAHGESDITRQLNRQHLKMLNSQRLICL